MVNIYLDISGSMNEMGKNSAQLYLAKSIEDYCNFKGINTAFFTLDGAIIKSLISIKSLNDIKLDIKNIKPNSILLSDGLFHCKEGSIFDMAISIGIDSDNINLRKISTKVFTSDDVLVGLEYLFYRNNLINTSVNEKEDEDEW